MSLAPLAALDRWADLSDEQVVAEVLTGHTAVFEALIRRHNQRLYRAARAILRNEAEAEDVMQQAYVNAYLHLDQFAGRSSFATWLTKIALYEALTRARKLGRTVSLNDADDGEEEPVVSIRAEGPDPERQAFAGELRGVIESAVEALPAAYRTVFMLREVEGMSTAETAGVLGIREDAVKTRLHRAKHLLRDTLFDRVGATGAETFTFHASRCDRMVARVFATLSAPAR